MNTQTLGTSDLVVSRLSYGNMRCVSTWNPAEATPEKRAEGVKSHIAAYEAGYTLFDTADIYCHGVCEEVLGQTLRENPEMKDKIVITTKGGIRFSGQPDKLSPQRYDFSRKYLSQQVEKSLKSIGVDSIDMYHLHRPDLLMDPHEVAGLFDELHQAGKVKWFAVSNFLPTTLQMLQSAMKQKIVVNQVEIHLGRLDNLFDGTLDQCIEHNITPLAWSPLGGGWLGGGRELPKNDLWAKRAIVVTELDAIAQELGTTRTVVALAWLLKHPAKIIPIIGSNNPKNIQEAAKADAIELSRDQWYRLTTAARGKPMP